MADSVSGLFGTPHSRRDLLRTAGVVALGAAVASACAKEESAPKPGSKPGEAPKETFSEPRTKLSGDLKILLWSHFVPSHDTWFDKFVKDWGAKVGVNVTVDHVDQAQIPTRIAAEIQAGQGHDLIQYIATLSQYEPSVVDMTDVTQEASKRHGTQLDICRKSSFNPNTNKFYAYSPGWVPDPGDYRKSLWEAADMPDGPQTWDDLLAGGTKIKQTKGVQLGVGLSQEIDSNMAGRALMWSYGASEQDANEQVVLNSPETVAAVDFMTKLFKQSMTNEVFAWNPASNNQGVNPTVANDIFFVPALKGPKAAFAAQHVMYNWITPKHARNVDAAKEFLLHYTANFASACWHSKLYDFPA